MQEHKNESNFQLPMNHKWRVSLPLYPAYIEKLYGYINFLELPSVHPETPKIFPKLALWTPNNGYLGIQSFSFGSVSGWTLPKLYRRPWLVGWIFERSPAGALLFSRF
jgi:hypothetical protein